MFFISRTNKAHHYIAHIQPLHRYIATLLLFAILITGWLYAIYYPLTKCIAIASDELAQLRKKYESTVETQSSIKNLRLSLETMQRNNSMHKHTNLDDYFKSELAFVFDSAQQASLQLNAYTALGIKEKGWYKKEKSHMEWTGEFTQCMRFLEMVKNAQKMILCTNIILSTLENNLFNMSCDISIVAIMQ